MKSLRNLVALGVIGLLSGMPAHAAGSAIVKALAPLEKAPINFAIGVDKVRGTTARQMLEDYAVRVKGFDEDYKVIMRMEAKQFPETDDGQSIVGLTRIIDVVDYIVMPNGSFDGSKAEERAAEKLVQDLLFKVRDLGGKVGVESHNWSTCGVSFPGVFILDLKRKEVISVSPDNTDC